MKKFKLTVNIGDFIVYRSVLTFTDEQYQNMLKGYEGSFDWGIDQTNVLERLTEGAFSEKHDYVKESPDAVVAYMVCKHVELFSSGEGWTGTYEPLNSKQASAEVEIDETGQIDWHCEVIE